MSRARARARRWTSEGVDYATAPFVRGSESVLVSGFWRSGTTWLLELTSAMLGAKSVFEPFHPYVPAYRNAVARELGPGSAEHDLQAYLPTLGEDPGLAALLDLQFERAVRSVLRGQWVRKSRHSLTESLRRRTVVKLVNAQFSLGYLQDRYSLPILHVTRDPRGVLASIRRRRWGLWLHELSLRRQLLEGSPARVARFEAWSDQVDALDRELWWLRVAGYWAITELEAKRFATGAGRDRIQMISYEDMVSSPVQVAGAALRAAGVEVTEAAEELGMKPSAMSVKDRKAVSASQRKLGWQRELGTEDSDRIVEVVRRLGMEIEA